MWARTKGVREWQEIVTYFMALDRSRGATYHQLAKIYNLDVSNIHKRVRNVQVLAKRKSHCINGHIFSMSNSIWQKGYKGKLERKCKKCLNARRRLKYKNDLEYREKQKAKSRKYKCHLNPAQPSQ